jgi:hypothetical protein
MDLQQRARAIVAPVIESDEQWAAQADATAAQREARGDHNGARRSRETAQRHRDSAARLRAAAERYGQEPEATRSPGAVSTLGKLHRHAVHTDLVLGRVLTHLGLAAPTEAEIDAALGLAQAPTGATPDLRSLGQ